MQAGANSFGRVSETRQLSENDQVNARHQVYQHAIGSFDWLQMLNSGNAALNRIMAPPLFLVRVAPPIRCDRHQWTIA
jgi:hypothetical protein